jgi:acetaldehyde dehydrogenase
MKKVNIGIIGTGNIGTDLLFKVQRSKVLNCSLFMGRREDSEGIRLARSLGVRVSTASIEALEQSPELCDIIFDATSAKTHIENSKILKKLGKFTIDLTPARIGQMCVPSVNLSKCLSNAEMINLNMITCGGQAAVPLIYAVKEVQDSIKYAEVVASISSKSAGLGTRNNIDEFTQTTKEAIVEIAGVSNAKAIITLNPAEPPVNMHNTIFMLIDNPNMDIITENVCKMEETVRQYVPGYKLILKPILENGRITMMVQVRGAGDYLPEYAGNLDIITCAAIRVAEQLVINNKIKSI